MTCSYPFATNVLQVSRYSYTGMTIEWKSRSILHVQVTIPSLLYVRWDNNLWRVDIDGDCTWLGGWPASPGYHVLSTTCRLCTIDVHFTRARIKRDCLLSSWCIWMHVTGRLLRTCCHRCSYNAVIMGRRFCGVQRCTSVPQLAFYEQQRFCHRKCALKMSGSILAMVI